MDKHEIINISKQIKEIIDPINNFFIKTKDIHTLIKIAGLHGYMNANQADLVAKVNSEADWNDDVESSFHSALKDFKANNTW